MADEHGLIPVYKEEFHHVFTEHRGHPEFGPLLVRMKVVDSKGESAMDLDQWDAASAWSRSPTCARADRFCVLSDIYVAFAFQKR